MMFRLTITSIILLSLWAQLGIAQNQSKEDPTIAGGIEIHAAFSPHGYGFGGSYLTGPNERQTIWGLDVFQVKDPREVRLSPKKETNIGGYTFGKTHKMWVINPSVGRVWDLATRSHLNLLNLRLGVKGGPAIGLLNPYYVQVLDSRTGEETIEAFDPERHNASNIRGQARTFQGAFDPTFRVGLSVKGFAWVDFSSSDLFINGMMLGIQADVFPQQVPLLAETSQIDNRRAFVTAVLGFMIGSRWSSRDDF
ncbi:hypothetical protein [Pontibacter sp. G13]|uniref:hypothetical protein n=1 Tax=Pontibacter sp. G13 TaxID=3074898 RepID=UPI00288AD71C|nr:hypothetical protein [Pontibacter sp. G13]WNJ16121.1 hypothetical protein RJD25_14760 [Pontibacter sp. G13]